MGSNNREDESGHIQLGNEISHFVGAGLLLHCPQNTISLGQKKKIVILA